MISGLAPNASNVSIIEMAANVNSYCDVDGSGGISSPITRAVNGQLTEVDGNVLSPAWAIAVVLLVAAVVLLVAQIRRQRRRGAGRSVRCDG